MDQPEQKEIGFDGLELQSIEPEQQSKYESEMKDYYVSKAQKYKPHVDAIMEQFNKNELTEIIKVNYSQFMPTPHIQVLSSINYEVVIINYRWGYYQLAISLLNIKEQNFNHGRYFNKKSFGKIYKGKFQKQQFVIKCLEFTDEVNKMQTIMLALSQYFLLKVGSILGFGPKVSNLFGFDLLVYDKCIQFCMEECLSYKKSKMFDFLYENMFLMHRLKIIHFDIKPENIMFSPAQQKLVFIDFGLSSIINEEVGFKTKTQFKGTLEFCIDEMKRLLKSNKANYLDVYYNDLFGLQKSIESLKRQFFIEQYEEVINQDNQQPKNWDYLYLFYLKYLLTFKKFNKFQSFLTSQMFRKMRFQDLLIFTKQIRVNKQFFIKQFYQKFRKQLSESQSKYIKKIITPLNYTSLYKNRKQERNHYLNLYTKMQYFIRNPLMLAKHFKNKEQQLFIYTYFEICIQANSQNLINLFLFFLDNVSFTINSFNVNKQKRQQISHFFIVNLKLPKTNKYSSNLQYCIWYIYQYLTNLEYHQNKQEQMKHQYIMTIFKLLDFLVIMNLEIDTLSFTEFQLLYNFKLMHKYYKLFFLKYLSCLSVIYQMRIKPPLNMSRIEFNGRLSKWIEQKLSKLLEDEQMRQFNQLIKPRSIKLKMKDELIKQLLKKDITLNFIKIYASGIICSNVSNLLFVQSHKLNFLPQIFDLLKFYYYQDDYEVSYSIREERMQLLYKLLSVERIQDDDIMYQFNFTYKCQIIQYQNQHFVSMGKDQYKLIVLVQKMYSMMNDKDYALIYPIHIKLMRYRYNMHVQMKVDQLLVSINQTIISYILHQICSNSHHTCFQVNYIYSLVQILCLQNNLQPPFPSKIDILLSYQTLINTYRSIGARPCSSCLHHLELCMRHLSMHQALINTFEKLRSLQISRWRQKNETVERIIKQINDYMVNMKSLGSFTQKDFEFILDIIRIYTIKFGGHVNLEKQAKFYFEIYEIYIFHQFGDLYFFQHDVKTAINIVYKTLKSLDTIDQGQLIRFMGLIIEKLFHLNYKHNHYYVVLCVAFNNFIDTCNTQTLLWIASQVYKCHSKNRKTENIIENHLVLIYYAIIFNKLQRGKYSNHLKYLITQELQNGYMDLKYKQSIQILLYERMLQFENGKYQLKNRKQRFYYKKMINTLTRKRGFNENTKNKKQCSLYKKYFLDKNKKYAVHKMKEGRISIQHTI